VKLDSTFAALADPTRRDLLTRLESGELTLSDLAAPLPMSLMAVQKHVRVLEDAGLVTSRKVGRSRFVRLRAPGLTPVTEWLRRAETRWNAAFDRLEEALEEEEEEE
jgi:DNA-binding transcriptional ArsR family regulator